MGTPTAERYTPSGAASAKEKGALGGVAQHAAGGVGTDLFSADIPTHERPEVIAGQSRAEIRHTSHRSCNTPSSSRGRWRKS